MTALGLRTIARALGGEISGRQILAPGPGHSRFDRSLSIRIEPAAPGGFVVHSFAGDDPIVCKDHVRQRLGLPEWKPGDEQDRRDSDGSKLDRRMLGVVHRAAVMLDPIGTELAIGEGIETCMAARQLGVRPTWALGSTGGIAGFPILEGVKQLTILGETGAASREAIQFCGRRWRRADRRVFIVMPSVGTDLNDELLKESV
jgi:hypothetical protein